MLSESCSHPACLFYDKDSQALCNQVIISGRLIFSLMNEAIWTLYEGVGRAEDIDSMMKLGAGHPMGPLALADFVGLDTVLSVMQVLQEGFGDKYRPCPLLSQHVHAGHLGVKTGRGFFQYGEGR